MTDGAAMNIAATGVAPQESHGLMLSLRQTGVGRGLDTATQRLPGGLSCVLGGAAAAILSTQRST